MADVTIENLRKEYGSLVAVDDISLTLPEGELLVLVGPSGSGKSTALEMIAGLTEPTGGTIEFGSEEVTDMLPEDRDISMVFQDLALYPHMTAFENVAFPLRADGDRPDSEVRDQVVESAELVDADHLLEDKVTELSGGQRQRVALARALVREPEVFLLDEPLSDLDELLKRKLRSEIANLQNQLEITAVHVTHDQEEAMTIGDRIAVMWEGDIAQLGTPRDVFEQPATPFVASFIGSPQMNMFHVTVERLDDDVVVLGNDDLAFHLRDEQRDAVEAATSDRLTVGIRPQHVGWAGTSPSDETPHVGVRTTVVEMIGTQDIVHCRTDAGTELRASFESETVSEEQDGYLTFDPDALHLYDGQEENSERLN
jgi:multiple sugar transport system ATP-binding protein